MLKKLLLALIITTCLFADDKVEVYATKMDTIGNIVHATGEVNVIYRNYFISAQEAKYNRDNGDLELFDNIRVTQGDSYKILGKYARLNIKDKTRLFQPFYMLEKKSKVWISGKKGLACAKDLDIESGMLSGCNPNDPLWKMQFSSSDYDEKSKWLNIYNTRLYIYDIPVLYTPYFGYSLDTKRQTGLLLPSFGISSDEGVYYEQPFYLALDNWWDLELKPQTRTLRGNGIYSTFRFVDSKTSRGELNLGWFKEYSNFYNDNQLVNKEHFGLDFRYDNNNFINQWFGTSLGGQSAIFADIHYLNDVDYLNLSTNDTTTSSTATQVFSRVNLFYNNQNNYFGSYFKYYQNLTQDKYESVEENNLKTLQQLPVMHYHSYLDSVFKNHVLYSIDLQSTNIHRESGVGVIQTNLNIPLSLQTSLFDEYINIAYKGQIFAQSSNFKGQGSITKDEYKDDYQDGYYARNYNVLQVSTQVSKAFSEFTHTMGLRTNYVFPDSETRYGYYEDQKESCSDIANAIRDPKCDFYSVNDITESINLEFSQYLFDSLGAQILYHKLSQNIVYQSDSQSLGDLENEIDYKVTPAISLYNTTLYNYDENLFSEIYNKLTYIGYGASLEVAHLYQDNYDTDTGVDRYSSYLTSSLGYTYDEHYSYKAVFNYDLYNFLKKTAEVGFLYKKRCWDFGIRYVENNRPILTKSGTYNSIYDRYLYFTILLKPIMKSSPDMNSAFTYKLPELYNGE